MATFNKVRGTQWALNTEAQIVGTDSMLNTAATPVLQVFNATGAGPFEPIALPPNAVVIGGDITVDVVSNDTGAVTMAVGDSAVANRYLAATSLKALGRTALVPTGYRGVGEDIRLTFVNTNGDATTGKYSVRVLYIVSGRMTEQQAT